MIKHIGPYKIDFSTKDNPAGGAFCYPRITIGVHDVTAEALEALGRTGKTYFEGLDHHWAKQHALDELRPVLEKWTEGQHVNMDDKIKRV